MARLASKSAGSTASSRSAAKASLLFFVAGGSALPFMHPPDANASRTTSAILSAVRRITVPFGPTRANDPGGLGRSGREKTNYIRQEPGAARNAATEMNHSQSPPGRRDRFGRLASEIAVVADMETLTEGPCVRRGRTCD